MKFKLWLFITALAMDSGYPAFAQQVAFPDNTAENNIANSILINGMYNRAAQKENAEVQAGQERLNTLINSCVTPESDSTKTNRRITQEQLQQMDRNSAALEAYTKYGTPLPPNPPGWHTGGSPLEDMKANSKLLDQWEREGIEWRDGRFVKIPNRTQNN